VRWKGASARVTLDGREVKVTRLQSGAFMLKCSCYEYRGGSMPHRSRMTVPDLIEADRWIRCHDHSMLTIEDGKREMWRRRRAADEEATA